MMCVPETDISYRQTQHKMMRVPRAGRASSGASMAEEKVLASHLLAACFCSSVGAGVGSMTGAGRGGQKERERGKAARGQRRRERKEAPSSASLLKDLTMKSTRPPPPHKKMMIRAHELS